MADERDQQDVESVSVSECTTGLLSLPDELIRDVAAFLVPKDLVRFESTCAYLNRIDTDHIWEKACESRWEPWAMYRLTPGRRRDIENSNPRLGWKELYRLTEIDAARTEITDEELEERGWYLNFSLGMDGMRGETLHRCVFKNGFLYLQNYPPLQYSIVPGLPSKLPLYFRDERSAAHPYSDKQWLRVHDFPPHFVSRMKHNAEWLIVNDNVTFHSCALDSREYAYTSGGEIFEFG